jgi:DNA-binding SARP family transcriptional activator
LYSNVLGEDSCREAAAAGVMRCAMNLGERALAIATYQQICNSLLDNLGADPSPDLTLLYQQVA